MSMDLWRLLLAILFTNVLAQSQEHPLIQERIRAVRYKHRCTRRFTPGVCLDDVTSVWSFQFQNMNCTERLGCPQSYRTNRFRSYDVCMRRCQPLIDLYLQILSYGGDNDTQLFLRTKPSMELRRDGSIDLNPKVSDPLAAEDEEYPGDEAIMASLMYGDKYPNQVDNVDLQPEARDGDDYFNFH